MSKTISIMGDTQREQWHGVVNMLRQLGGDMTREGRAALCDELDRYIDSVEDILDEIRAEEQGGDCVLVDHNGNPKKDAEEQESLVRWALENRWLASHAVKTDEWAEVDAQDIGEFLAIIRRRNPAYAVADYWKLDTLARDVFCDIMAKWRQKGEQA